MKQIIFTAFLILAFCCAAFAQSDKNPCPTVSISTRNELAGVNESYFFIAEVGKEVAKYDVKYNWITRNAEILEGQGTKIIRALKKSNDGGLVTLEMTGLPENCTRTVSESIPVVCYASSVQIDEFGQIPMGDLRARLDNFLNMLHDNPTGKGLVVISDDKKSLSLIKLYNNHFAFREFERDRISFLVSSKTTLQTQLYFIPADADNPVFENSLIVEAKDFDKLENLFRPKPTTKNRKK